MYPFSFLYWKCAGGLLIGKRLQTGAVVLGSFSIHSLTHLPATLLLPTIPISVVARNTAIDTIPACSRSSEILADQRDNASQWASKSLCHIELLSTLVGCLRNKFFLVILENTGIVLLRLLRHTITSITSY